MHACKILGRAKTLAVFKDNAERFRDYATYQWARSREGFDSFADRVIPKQDIDLLGLITLPQRLVAGVIKWGVSIVILIIVYWLASSWIDNKLRAHYLSEVQIEAQKKKNAALNKQKAANAKLTAELDAIRKDLEAAQASEAEANKKAREAMFALAAKGTSTDLIDRETINKIIREANAI